MATNVAISEFIDCVLNGIKKAKNDYSEWSGGEGLYQAPEYLQTVKIAQEIAKIKKSKYITLEDNIDYILTSTSDENEEINFSERMRPNGRSDIVLWWASGYARAVIEVKRWVYNISHITSDLDRIHAMLYEQLDDNRLQFGISAFYISQYFKQGDAITKLEKHMQDKLFLDIKEYAKDNNLKIKIFYEMFEENDNLAWGAVTLQIQINNQ